MLFNRKETNVHQTLFFLLQVDRTSPVVIMSGSSSSISGPSTPAPVSERVSDLRQQAELERKMLSLKIEETDFDELDVMHEINTALTSREECVDVSASSLGKALQDAKNIFLDTGLTLHPSIRQTRSIKLNPLQHTRGRKSAGMLKGYSTKLRSYPRLSWSWQNQRRLSPLNCRRRIFDETVCPPQAIRPWGPIQGGSASRSTCRLHLSRHLLRFTHCPLTRSRVSRTSSKN